MIGSFPLRGYALSILAGIIIALFWTRARYAAQGGDPEVVTDVALLAVPAGILGGRLYHLATDWQRYWGPGGSPGDWWKITNGGLGIWGAVALGALAAWVVLRIKKLPLGPFADALAPALITAQAIGRLGNWFNQEIYGRPTTVPWALEIYERVDPNGTVDPIYGHSDGVVLATVHPTFLYELGWNLLVAAFLVWAHRRFQLVNGQVFALYVAGYTLGRFWIELMRSDEATLIDGLRVNTITSTVCFLAAVAYFVWSRRSTARAESTDSRRITQ